MKIVPGTGKFVFHLAKREKHLLSEVLRLYPCLPSGHHLKKMSQMPDASKRLLDEALAEQRAETKMAVAAFLSEPRRFVQADGGWRFGVSTEELEWLLQVLNDIRVGSWVLLGSPEERLELTRLNEQTAPHFWAMEMAGFFQMEMLKALNR